MADGHDSLVSWCHDVQEVRADADRNGTGIELAFMVGVEQPDAGCVTKVLRHILIVHFQQEELTGGHGIAGGWWKCEAVASFRPQRDCCVTFSLEAESFATLGAWKGFLGVKKKIGLKMVVSLKMALGGFWFQISWCKIGF